jgi:hypothetical protein
MMKRVWPEDDLDQCGTCPHLGFEHEPKDLGGCRLCGCPEMADVPTASSKQSGKVEKWTPCAENCPFDNVFITL